MLGDTEDTGQVPVRIPGKKWTTKGGRGGLCSHFVSSAGSGSRMSVEGLMGRGIVGRALGQTLSCLAEVAILLTEAWHSAVTEDSKAIMWEGGQSQRRGIHLQMSLADGVL